MRTIEQYVKELTDALDEYGLPYAIGGSLALNLWAQPRPTEDIDLSVFVPCDKKHTLAVVDAFDSIGLITNRAGAVRQVLQSQQIDFYWDGMKIEVFCASSPFYDDAKQRRVLANLEGRPIWYLSAESLSVFKMIFGRGKDLIDVENMLKTQGPYLDRAYVRKWLVRLTSKSSAEVRNWDKLTRLVP